MAEKTLNAYVVLGGKIDNSFTALGQSLINLGGHIDGISQKLINFGKESVQTYRSYEDSMLEAQVALSTNYGRGTKALGEVMDALDAQASEWAATTIFHTDDVANAIAEAAHANWDLDKILEGMPAAMRLAQAGSLDLSTGLDYIIKSTNAAGIEFSDLMEWVDEWTYAANSSAGDVEQFGEAMLRMGTTMKFADNKEELLTMLAVLHDAGTTGSNAGTLLRNSMIRLIAPTKKATDAMAELGLSESDVEEALAEVEGDTAAAVARLEEAGFSAYNSKGELKDFTEIFEDLSAATRNMTEQEKYDIWSAIFPTRTITGAMALIEAADNNWNNLLEDLESGKAAGYGDYAAETMMSGLTGSIKTFNSKVEDLKKLLGQQLAPQVENIMDNFGKLIDKIRSGGADNGVSSGLDWLSGVSDIVGNLADNLDDLDPALFDALVGGLGGIAALGPALLIGGFAIRGIGTALSVFTGTVVGRVVLAAAALSIIGTAISKYNEAKFLENFGNMEIDTTKLDESMTRIHDAFKKAKEPTQAFADALKASVDNYNAAATTFSATMMEDLLADQTLTGEALETKLAQYRQLGSDMVQALKDGITSSADKSAEFWAMVIKGKNGTVEKLAKNKLYGGILKALNDERADALKNAENIGDDLQKAITKAWEDGHLDEGEREKIKTYFRELNKAMIEAEREAQEEANIVERKLMMDKAQGMSFEQMDDYITNTIMKQRQAEIDSMTIEGKKDIYSDVVQLEKAQKKYDELMAAGKWQEAQEYEQEITLYKQNIEGKWDYLDRYIAGIYSIYDDMIMDWVQGTLADTAREGENTLADAVPFLQQAAEWMISGTETNPFVLQDYIRENGGNINDLYDYYQHELRYLGGVEEVKKRIGEYTESGNAEQQRMADRLKEVLAIYSILNPDNGYAKEVQGETKELTLDDLLSLYTGGAFDQHGMEYLKMLTDPDFDSLFLEQQHASIEAVTQGYVDALAKVFSESYNVDMINGLLGGERELDPQLRDDFAAAILLGMTQEERERYRIGGAESDLWNAERDAEQKRREADAATDRYYNHWFSGVFHEGTGLPSNVQEAVQAAEKAEAIVQKLREENPEVEVNLQPETEAIDAKLGEGFAATVNLIPSFSSGLFQFSGGVGGGGAGFHSSLLMKAKGGRGTQPTIFAEAGIPEWYIPEEHTKNTAELILAAAANSGFGLIDLAEMAGARLFAEGGTDGSGSTAAVLDWGSLGGSAGSGDAGDINVQYSPVIHSENADGVERKLKEDKARFRRFFEEFMAEREMYRSMTAYT